MTNETRQLRKVGREEFERILAAHAVWLTTGGEQGSRADLSFADLSSIDFSGLQGEGQQPTAINLSRAALSGVDLTGVDLRGSIFKGADLSGATLAGADLRGADLSDAILRDATFFASKLAGAELRGAVLQKADLEDAVGALNGQFAGADLARAKVPLTMQTFDSLPRIEELSKTSVRLFIAMILGCTYAWLTIGTTTDARLLSNSASSPLPIIQTAVPISTFFLVAPLVLLSLYVYLHLYLQKLWKDLADLPAVFPDGKAVYDKAYPWLLNTLAGAFFRKSGNSRSLAAVFEVWISVFFVWALTPLTLLVFWLRYLPRHEWTGALFEAGLVSLCVGFAVWSYRTAAASFTSRGTLGGWIAVLAGAVTVLVTVVVTYGAIEGVQPNTEAAMSSEEGKALSAGRIREGVPKMLNLVSLSAFADLSEQDVSTKPAGWFLRNDEDLPRFVNGAQLRGMNLRYAVAKAAFLVKADLRRADLRGANLVAANLQEALLGGARMQKVYLFQANLNKARMNGVDLSYAYLADAKLDGARMIEAQLQGAILKGASLRGTNLSGAQLQDAKLAYADLDGAILFGANLVGANLEFVRNLKQVQLIGTCVSDKTVLPHGLVPPLPSCSVTLPRAVTTSKAATSIGKTAAQPAAGRKEFTEIIVGSEKTCAISVGEPGDASPETLMKLNEGEVATLGFKTAIVGRFWTDTPVPDGAPSGTKVIQIPPGDGRSGYLRVTFDFPDEYSDARLEGSANVDDLGRVFLNGQAISAPLFCTTCRDRITQFGSARFSTSSHFVRGRNVLLIAVANAGAGPSGAVFYARIVYTAASTSKTAIVDQNCR
jgi:uncharacterized protein YjbI with pentapeptide repeats